MAQGGFVETSVSAGTQLRNLVTQSGSGANENRLLYQSRKDSRDTGPLVILGLSRRWWNISLKCSGSGGGVRRYMKLKQMLDQCA